MRVYYAHCQSIYDTPQEARDLELLENEWHFEIINPSDVTYTTAAERVRRQFTNGEHREYHDGGSAVMALVFLPLLSAAKCDALVFRALPDGRIPAGVAKEIQTAQMNGLPVLELPYNFEVRRRGMTVDDTRAYLREVGQR